MCGNDLWTCDWKKWRGKSEDVVRDAKQALVIFAKALYGNEILNANSTSGFSGGHWSDRGIHRDMT